MKFDRLLQFASEHEPDTAAAQLGFETRLRARLAELRDAPDTGAAAVLFSRWLWRVSFGLAPLIAAGVVFWFFLLSQGLSLPAGTDGVFSQLTALFPGDLH